MDMKALVGSNVKAMRKAKGWTQEQFSVRSGISQQYISQLENGKRNPSVVMLFELAQALDTTPSVLVTAMKAD